MTSTAKTIWAIVLILIVAGIAWFVYSGMHGNTDEVSVRATVTNFGMQQQKVSLLAPDASQQIAQVYEPYVAPALLATWEATPSTAPGRQTSSPWPDHIDINAITKTNATTYNVSGSVILMTSDEVAKGGNAGTIPVTLTLEKQSGKWLITVYTQSAPAPAANTQPVTTGSTQTYSHQNPAFTFAYGNPFTLAEGAPANQDATYWSEFATSSMPGTTYATLALPKSVQPGTNFSDARLTVGRSTNAQAISTCLTAGNGNTSTIAKVTINGVPFVAITTSDAGAGNLYTTTSYRTVRDNACYAIEYTVHSTNIANYPAGTVTAYDQNMVKGLLDGVVNSFAFGS